VDCWRTTTRLIKAIDTAMDRGSGGWYISKTLSRRPVLWALWRAVESCVKGTKLYRTVQACCFADVGDGKDERRRVLDASDLPIPLKLLKNTKTALSPDSVGQIGQMRHRWKAGIE
jgi:hypothetical protein